MSEASSQSGIRSLFPFLVMCFGGFMALLDIQIVASSLQHIGGGLSAAQDEISWVQTAYLIAEIIVIPLSGWLTRVFSTRWLFTASAAGFTATSMLCGIAWEWRRLLVQSSAAGSPIRGIGTGCSMSILCQASRSRCWRRLWSPHQRPRRGASPHPRR
jgi:MFS transporter, DHA2 family, multidrug resistance protein